MNTLKVHAAAVLGISGRVLDVEVMPDPEGDFEVSGLPDSLAREVKARVRSALRVLGFRVRGMAVNVLDSNGTRPVCDLAVAVGVLAAQGKVPAECLDGTLFLGDLSLDGEVRPVPGVLPMVLQAARQGLREVVVPAENACEVALVPGVTCRAAEHLAALAKHLDGTEVLPVVEARPDPVPPSPACDLSDVHGQAHAKRALEVAAAGGHSLLLVGPPGSGKTMLARRLVTLLPPMTNEERLEVTAIHSVAGLAHRANGLVTMRPFRAPHHTASLAAILGIPRPGEVTLAHRGVLFLDELPEWRREVLGRVRQVLGTKKVLVDRPSTTLEFPADFLLVASMNPCPCGYWGDQRHRCSCSPAEVQRYRKRVLDFLPHCDLHVEVPSVPFRDLARETRGETSEAVRSRVVAAREFARTRPAKTPLRDLPAEAVRLLDAAVERLGLNAGSLKALLKVARTIADLDGRDKVETVHVSEAIQYRILDRAS